MRAVCVAMPSAVGTNIFSEDRTLDRTVLGLGDVTVVLLHRLPVTPAEPAILQISPPLDTGGSRAGNLHQTGDLVRLKFLQELLVNSALLIGNPCSFNLHN